MTDQEREIDRVIKYIRSCKDAGIDTTITINKRKNHLILNALEEVLQYRSIGTVEEFSKSDKNVKTLSRMYEKLSDKQAAEYHALQEYEKIGTVEECREYVKKQRAKKVNGRYKTTYTWDAGYCPSCNCGITARWNYCQNCGQAISWEESEEEDD